MQEDNVSGSNADAVDNSFSLEFTVEERLRLQNYHLKRTMLGMELAMKQDAISKELDAVVATIRQRTGVDIRDDRYEVDIEHGRCTTKQAAKE